jgi:tetratricopeptide (TPR) repeat protein
MPTKAKTAQPAKTEAKDAKTAKAAKETTGTLEKQLSHAIEMVDTGKANEAYQLFEAISKEASEKGNFGLAKVARCYLVHKQNLEAVPLKADPIQETVFLLNAKKPEATLEKIETMVKAKNASAHAYYLKALAHASVHQFDLSAQSLKQAIEMDPALLNIYRLEPDFKICRRSSLFADFELA